MKTAADLLKSKPCHTVHTITPTASVFDAVTLMADKDIGALLVMEGAEVAGMITERDYARKIALMSRSSSETKVSARERPIPPKPSEPTQACGRMFWLWQNRFSES